MLLGSDDVQMTLLDYVCVSLPGGGPAAPERHRTPRQNGRATHAHGVVGEERALSPPNSASGGRRKEPSRGFFFCVPVFCFPFVLRSNSNG